MVNTSNTQDEITNYSGKVDMEEIIVKNNLFRHDLSVISDIITAPNM